MNLTNVSEMKDFFSNRKAKLIKRYIFVGLLSSITLFASIKAISITNKFIHLHGNDPLTSTNVWYIPLALFSPILAIISVGIFIQAILKLKNYRKNIFTRNDFKININEKNNCLTNIGNYININSVVNLLLSINLIDDLIYLSINKIEQIESLLLYNQTLLK